MQSVLYKEISHCFKNVLCKNILDIHNGFPSSNSLQYVPLLGESFVKYSFILSIQKTITYSANVFIDIVICSQIVHYNETINSSMREGYLKSVFMLLLSFQFGYSIIVSKYMKDHLLSK